MLDDHFVSRALRDLAEQIGRAEDSLKLQQLVLEINRLLDAIESQASKLEGGQPPLRQ